MYTFRDKNTGLEYCLKEADETSKSISDSGVPGLSFLEWCCQFLTNKSTYLDIGASYGPRTFYLSKKCRKVIAFEPDRLLYNCLNVGIAANNRNNIKTYNAIPHQNVNITRIYPENTVKYRFYDFDSNITSATVNSIVIDKLGITDIDLIHIFAEGQTINACKGAITTLWDNKFPPIMYYESNTTWCKRAENWFKELGYQVMKITGSDHIYLACDHFLRPKIEPPPKYNIEDLIDKYTKEEPLPDLEAWQFLINHYINIKENFNVISCCDKASQIYPDHNWFKEKLAMHIEDRNKGYELCETVIMFESDWHTRNKFLNLQSKFMNRLPLVNVTSLNHELPEKFISSSSSIISTNYGFLVNMRAVNYSITSTGNYIIRDDENIVCTRNFLLKFDKDWNKFEAKELTDCSGITLYSVNIKGLEDIRLINEHELLATYLEINESRTPQICYCKFENDQINTVIPLSVSDNIQCEKNWVGFYQDDKLHIIYSWHPFRVYQLDTETGSLISVKNEYLSDLNLSNFRGSPNPITYKNGWLATIHEVYHDSPRKYYHRLVWFNKDFTILKYSKIFYFESPNIEYNIGLSCTDEGLVFIYSINDNCTRMGFLSYDNVDEMLQL